MSSLLYFHAAETAKGRRDYLQSQLQGITHIVETNESTRHETTQMLEAILATWIDERKSESLDTKPFECLLDPLNPCFKLGIINRNQKIAFIAKERLITDTLRQDYYNTLQTALTLHDELEDIYKSATNFNLLSDFTESFIKAQMTDLSIALPKKKKPDVFHRFLGSFSAAGTVDFIPQLTKNIQKRFFIKGRAGTGKSTFLKKIANKAQILGLDTEAYHCGFDPDSLDMVIIRSLNMAVFDSTAPHEHVPKREGDQLIDLYGTYIDPEIDQKRYHDITLIQNDITEETNKAMTILMEDETIKKQQDLVQKEPDSTSNERLQHYINKGHKS